MKRIICTAIVLVLTLAILVGCGGAGDVATTTGTTVPPTTTTTAAVTTTSAPKLYDFFSNMKQGDSVSLKGDVLIFFVIVDDEESAWTEDDVKSFKADQEAAMSRLTAQAKRYGAQLQLRADYVQCKISGTMTRDNYSFAVDKALTYTDYIFDYSAVREIKEDYSADEVAVVFAFNKAGRSFAIQKTSDWVDSFEYVILYSNDSEYALCHELLHVFGAQDFYYHSAVEKAAEKHFGSSIMIDATADVDDLTAYLVGWTDELSDKAKAFLDDTAHITQDEVDGAHDNNMITGKGTRRYGNAIYTGEMEAGIPNGEGTMRWDNGDVYVGGWSYGKFSGYGEYTLATGLVCKGEWKDGLMHGKGSLDYPSGAFYEGDFVNDQPHGKGKYVLANGDVYEGEFEGGRFCGKGKYTYADGGYRGGEYYDGEWKDDKMHGFGTMVWENGDKYVGYWSNGKMHGQGTYTYADGEVLKGTFNNNNFYG